MPHAPDSRLKKIGCFEEMHDITAILGLVPDYPGDRSFSLDWIVRPEDSSAQELNSGFRLSALSLSSHAGTHIDAPTHLSPKAKTLDQYPPQRFLIPAQVVSVGSDESIQPGCLDDIDVEEGDAVLFQTKNSSNGLLRRSGFEEKYVYLSEAAAKRCVALGISMVGIDYLSVDRYGDEAAPVHHCLLENDVLILEGIDLQGVPPGKFILSCFPLRIKGNEAAPVRAVLLR
ncbi:MAG: cyclase family protein [Methanothrix sp.]|nr:cyclase family protein [Methanothrix sp.]